MTAIFAVTFVMSAVLICKWTPSHYDDDDDDVPLELLFATSLIMGRFMVYITWYSVHMPTRQHVALAVSGTVWSYWQDLPVTEHLCWRTARVTVTQVLIARRDARDFRFTKPITSTRVTEPCLGACASR